MIIITRAFYQAWYDEVLIRVAKELEQVIGDHIKGLPRIDRVGARAKSPDRFLDKAAKVDKNGKRKYANPLAEIQDIVGARVTVFYERDVQTVSKVLKRYFRAIEERTVVPDHEWKFGYFGRHFILGLPTEAIPQDIPLERCPTFFELQVKTLFQHAWAEAGHDIGYKPAKPLSADQERALAYTAAQAWGADRMFDELSQELIGPDS
jgi:putative GTP pyrophosphokinase